MKNIEVSTTGWCSPDGVFYACTNVEDKENGKIKSYIVGADEYGGDAEMAIKNTEKVKDLIEEIYQGKSQKLYNDYF